MPEFLPDRRHFLKHVAGLSALALPGARFIRTLEAAAATLRKAHRSLVIVWLSGGPPTIDMWDLKPGRSTGGEFRPIKTSADGIEICELLPTVAQQMKHLTVVRSLVTNEGDHMRGRVLMHTGRAPSPVVAFPSLGAVASYHASETTRRARDLPLPGFVSVGAPSEGPGFLGMAFAPFTVQDPSRPPANLRPPDSLGRGNEQTDRIRRRQRLFYAVEDGFRESLLPHLRPQERARHADPAKAHEDVYAKAFSLVASTQGKVFDIATERRSTIEEYGRNAFGKGCLLARKLVEAGVTCVEVDLGGWDMHNGVFPALRTRLPILDRGLGALVRDLVDRGLWSSTVVVCMGEFGRTPRINQNAGRDHWARCWSVVLGGGGLRGGQVFGATDADGMSVKGEQVAGVGDLFATLYQALGIKPDWQLRDNLGRPFPVAPERSAPIHGLV